MRTNKLEMFHFSEFSLWMDGLPIPPSINKQLIPSKGRLIKSTLARNFNRQINHFALANHQAVKQAQEHLKPWIKDGGLRVDCHFVFHVERLLTKTKKAESQFRILDANNRLKSTLDAVSQIIGIDDKYFLTGICEKVTCKSLEEERVLIQISPTRIKMVEEIEAQMKLDLSQISTSVTP